MAIDFSFRFGDVLMVMGWLGSFVWLVVSQRERLTQAQAEFRGEVALLKQADINLETRFNENREHMDQQFGAIDRKLDRIMDKIDGKADKDA